MPSSLTPMQNNRENMSNLVDSFTNLYRFQMSWVGGHPAQCQEQYNTNTVLSYIVIRGRDSHHDRQVANCINWLYDIGVRSGAHSCSHTVDHPLNQSFRETTHQHQHAYTQTTRCRLAHGGANIHVYNVNDAHHIGHSNHTVDHPPDQSQLFIHTEHPHAHRPHTCRLAHG